MNVRPSLLTVYETHFVPLGERLRPGLSGFLSGVLLGLEDGSDHFDRYAKLIYYPYYSLNTIIVDNMETHKIYIIF